MDFEPFRIVQELHFLKLSYNNILDENDEINLRAGCNISELKRKSNKNG